MSPLKEVLVVSRLDDPDQAQEPVGRSESLAARTPSREQQYDVFVSLLARHDGSIRRFIRYLLPSYDGVDDVMQEVALECWNKFTEFRPVCVQQSGALGVSTGEKQTKRDEGVESGEEFVRWACVIARYKVMSWQRDRARDRLVFRDSVVEKLASSAIDLIEKDREHVSAVEQCLQELPAEQRRLVLSVHSPGESVSRIARETGENARRLYRKLNSLRGILSRCVEQRLEGELGHGS